MARERFGSALRAAGRNTSLFRVRRDKFQPWPRSDALCVWARPFNMRNDYIQSAAEVISDPYILVNVVSRRVKQLRRGYRPMISSLEKLSLEDIALREISERKITYEIAALEEPQADARPTRSSNIASAPMGRSGFTAHNIVVGADSRKKP